MSTGARLAGHVLGGFVLTFTLLQWAHYRDARLRIEELEKQRKREREEYDMRVKNNMVGFERVPDDDE